MLSGRRAFELSESEREEEPPKRSYKGAVKGFLIGVAVNLCAALILAVLKALLWGGEDENETGFIPRVGFHFKLV